MLQIPDLAVPFKDIPFDECNEAQQAAIGELMRLDYRDEFALQRSLASARIQQAIGTVKGSEAYQKREAAAQRSQESAAAQAKAEAEAKRVSAIKDKLYTDFLASQGGS